MKNRIIRLFLSALVLLLISSLSPAQEIQSGQASSSQVAVSDKNGKEAVCDGALEIIPSGQMTFTRKRYSAANPKTKAKPAKPRSNSRR